MLKKAKISSLIILVLIGCVSQRNKSPQVTIYVSADEQIAREIFVAFTKKTGIEVMWVGDTEASKTTALVHRILQERNNSLADVFCSSGRPHLGNFLVFAAKRLVPAPTGNGSPKKAKPRAYFCLSTMGVRTLS